MASQLDHVMTFDQACEQFTDCILPMIQEQYEQDGIPDMPARRECWNNWTDSLCQNEQISDWQAQNWSHHPSTD